jgi:hypothetical protein
MSAASYRREQVAGKTKETKNRGEIYEDTSLHDNGDTMSCQYRWRKF